MTSPPLSLAWLHVGNGKGEPRVWDAEGTRERSDHLSTWGIEGAGQPRLRSRT